MIYIATKDTHAFMGGTNSLRISGGGQKITILEPAPERTPKPKYFKYSRSDTIEGMFEEIKAVLDDTQIIHSPAVTASGGFYMAYHVEFDPELGYPTVFGGRLITEPCAAVFDADFEKIVTQLKVLKR